MLFPACIVQKEPRGRSEVAPIGMFLAHIDRSNIDPFGMHPLIIA